MRILTPFIVRPIQIFAIALASLVNAVPADELAVAPLFSSGTVLQRDSEIPIWGTAAPNSNVQISFAGQNVSTTTSKTGRWRAVLAPIEASNEPLEINIVGGPDELVIEDVLVGDVWLCAGQSNMAMRVDLARDAEKEKADSELPGVRVFTVDYQPSRNPSAVASGRWIASSPEAAGKFSACAFFFGRELHRKLDVPIGLIVAARGGSDITAWTNLEAQKNEPALSELLSYWEEKDRAYTPEVEAAEQTAYRTAMEDWKSAAATASSNGQPRPKKPRAVVNPRDHWHHPAVLYNGMIAPLVPYAIRGAIWYQGESNAFNEDDSRLYETQLRLLINDWRNQWDCEFPFAWVQLPFSSARQVAWARIRESMRRATTLPNTGMVVTLDLGEERLLHPKNKQAFAHRLALWARANVYGETVEWSGPLYTGHRVGNKGILVRFDHATGLAAKDDALVGFEVQDPSGDWHVADAKIRNDRVVLTTSATKLPTALRYAWANHPDGNLVNEAGLPASPFETIIANSPGKPDPTNSSEMPKRKPKLAPPDLTKPPLEPTNVGELPEDTKELDVFLLMGQSNMKGRGVMPAQPLRDPRIIMMHRRTDNYFLARHPLHLVGSPKDFSGADNAGVGPGLAFAQTLARMRPESRILLIPCAVGGTSITKWQKGQRLYDETIRRATLALNQGPAGKTRIAGALWLQGESDSVSEARISNYQTRLTKLIDDLRADIREPELPFIACTIGEMRADIAARKKINSILLNLPNLRPGTACVDGREFAKSIGDKVHFDTTTQKQHGAMFAELFLKLIEH